MIFPLSYENQEHFDKLKRSFPDEKENEFEDRQTELLTKYFENEYKRIGLEKKKL
jgi:hypothetical protein